MLPYSYIKDFVLNNFRNYRELKVSFSEGINIIFAPNGFGKTNILEAISFFSPGRGFRNANLLDILNKDESHIFHNPLWSIFGKIENNNIADKISIFTTYDDDKIKKNLRINEDLAKNQNILNSIFSIIWMTPQTELFFIDGAVNRRKFLDRAVYIIDPEHSTRVTKYEFLVRERMKVLTDNKKFDEKWLDVLERKIAEVGIAIATARNEMVYNLNKVFDEYDFNFPSLLVKINGYFEDMLSSKTAVEVENDFVSKLKENRQNDLRSKKTNFGLHRSDLEIIYKEKNINAEFCSTGEQKSFLISLTIAKSIVCKYLKNSNPILLLDELPSHLDIKKREILFNEIEKLKLQCFITGTEKSIFSSLENKANFMDLQKCN